MSGSADAAASSSRNDTMHLIIGVCLESNEQPPLFRLCTRRFDARSLIVDALARVLPSTGAHRSQRMACAA
jgi:hypothetical protein